VVPAAVEPLAIAVGVVLSFGTRHDPMALSNSPPDFRRELQHALGHCWPSRDTMRDFGGMALLRLRNRDRIPFAMVGAAMTLRRINQYYGGWSRAVVIL
jgi:hypothetical protein